MNSIIVKEANSRSPEPPLQERTLLSDGFAN